MLPPKPLRLERDSAKRTRSFHTFLILLSTGFILQFLVATSCLGQNWSGILAPGRAIDWSNSGATIPTDRTQCGATIAAYNGTAATINAAISGCGSGHYVLLGPGTFNLTTGIVLASNVTLRGSGSNSTFLTFTTPNSCGGLSADVCVGGDTGNYPGGPHNTATWTATSYTQGQTHITLSSKTNITAGMSIIVLDQLDDATDPGTTYECQDANCAESGPTGSTRTNRAKQQIVLVTAFNEGGCGANCATISPGLYAPNWSASKTPGAWWGNSVIVGAGIENLSMDHSGSSGTSGVSFDNAYGCWEKGVRDLQTNRNHVWLYVASHITIRDTYFYGTKNGASESYGVEAFGSSDSLIENVIFQHVMAPMMLNGECSGCVYGYNYAIDDYIASATTWMSPGIWIHGFADMTLFEGNIVPAFIADTFHGSHSFLTLYRNRLQGFDENKPTSDGQTIPVQPTSHSRYFNVVGNVLGWGTHHTQYRDLAPSGTNANLSIYTMGWGASNGTNSLTPDENVVATIMRWGNYDTVNNAVLECTAASTPIAACTANERGNTATGYPALASPSATFPKSFYLRAEPSWWGPITWPAIGPDVTGGNIANVGGHAYLTPAANCYLNVMGGSTDGSAGILPFDPTSCYGLASGGSLVPPSGLTAVVQ